MLTQIIDDDIVFAGIEDDKTRYPAASVKVLNGLQNFFIILAGDDTGIGTALVADLTDAPDGFQIKGIFIGVLGRRWQNHAKGFYSLSRQTFLRYRRLVAQFLYGFLYTLQA